MHKTDKNIYRASNLELLRIFSMVFIIMHHYFVHGNFQLENTEVHLPLVWVQLISILGKLGVNCFILITGYFMVTSKFKLLSILKIIIEVIFYSITITFVIYGLGLMDVNLNVLLMSILPIHFEMYWFATTYIVLYILTPFLNIFIKNISKRQLIKLILVLIILWSIFPMIVMPAVSFSVLGWFILVYFIAAYIRLSNSSFEKNWSYYLKLFCFLYVLLIMSVLLFDLCSIKFTFLRAYATYYSGMNRFIVLLMSISLFLTFKNLNIKYNRLINSIATTIFGVYLIHDHVLMRDFLWKILFKNNEYINNLYIIPHSIICITLVFFTCILIDKVRIKFIEKPLFNLLNKKITSLNLISNIKNKLSEVVTLIEHF